MWKLRVTLGSSQAQPPTLVFKSLLYVGRQLLGHVDLDSLTFLRPYGQGAAACQRELAPSTELLLLWPVCHFVVF